MGVGGLNQFWGAELKHRWYTGVRWGFQPHFHDLKSCSCENERLAILKQRAGKILVNKDSLCYYVLSSQ